MGTKVALLAGLKADHKISYVFKCRSLKGEVLGEFLRKNGLYLEEIRTWESHMKAGLENETKLTTSTKKYYQDRIKKLERELEEAQAIIEIQKKVRKILEPEEEKLRKKKEKKSSE